AHLDVSELLRQPISELLGVSAAAKATLEPLGIRTIFDLGCSWLFANARAAALAMEDGGPAARFGTPPGGLFHDGAADAPIDDSALLPLEDLRGLTKVEAQAIARDLDVATLRDLAFWPPHVFARGLVQDSIGSERDPDLAQTERLRPKFGEFPTERVY